MSNDVAVLLVEDNAGDILLIQQTLASAPYPIRLLIATDGEQALHLLEAGLKPNLIILDLNLPRVPGLFFLVRRQSDAPVVVFTSSDNPEEQKRAVELGAKEIVQKPMDLAAFQWQVAEIVRNWARPNADWATCG